MNDFYAMADELHKLKTPEIRREYALRQFSKEVGIAVDAQKRIHDATAEVSRAIGKYFDEYEKVNGKNRTASNANR